MLWRISSLQVRYACQTCYDNKAGPAYDLCPRCFEAEGSSHEHALVAQPVELVARDTTDKDPLIDSPFFETRVKFLNLCQVLRWWHAAVCVQRGCFHDRDLSLFLLANKVCVCMLWFIRVTTTSLIVSAAPSTPAP